MNLTVPWDELSITEVLVSGKHWSELHLESWGSIAESGAPSLPMLSVSLGVPFGASMDVKVIPGKDHKLHLSETILPVAEQKITWPKFEDKMSTPAFPTTELQYAENPAIYTDDEAFPGVLAEITGDGVQRHQRVISLNLYPIQYNPFVQDLTIYEDLLIEISFSGQLQDQKASALEESDVFENFFRQTLINYESAKNWRISSEYLNKLQTTEGMVNSLPFLPPDPCRRITITEEGFYYLSYTDLVNADVPIASMDPDKVQIFHMGEEIAIQYDDVDQDGEFDPEDGFIFYAQALESKYSQENVYWLTYDNLTSGRRMDVVDGTPVSAEIRPSFTKTLHLEENHRYISGAAGEDALERYLWTSIFAITPNTPKNWITNFNLTEPIDGSGTLTANLLGYTSNITYPDHHVKVYVNDVELPDAEVTWDGFNWQITQGTIPAGVLTTGDNEIKISLPHDTGVNYEIVYVDWLSLTFPSAFQTENGSISFRYEEGTWLFQVDGFSSNGITAYDISDPGLVKIIQNENIIDSGSSYSLQFQDEIPLGETKNYHVLEQSAYKTPQSIETIVYDPTDLSTTNGGADYILISHGDFMTQAQELATHRADQGWRTVLVDVQQIYDEFGYGVEGVEPIKQFLSYAFQNWEAPAPSFVVLLGDGHYDPKNFEGYGRGSFIPPYLAYADPGLGETAADNRYVTLIGDDPLAEMLLGRLPANSPEEANAIIDKIIAYENSVLTNPGDWQREVLAIASVADSAGSFPSLSNAILGDTIPQPLTLEKIYYKTTHDTLPEAVTALNNAINSGKLFINFVGHGFVDGWSAQKSPPENYLTTSSITSLTNVDLYPIILAMTCWEGYFIHPFALGDQESFGEVITKLPEAGAVASWSPTGLGIAAGHDRLNRGFYDAIFTGDAKLLGEATMAGKQNLWASGANLDLLDTYLLFGDPATKIALGFTAIYDDYSIDEDQTLTLTQGTGVLANDLHPQGASLTASLVDDVTHGTLSLASDGSFTYTPYPDFFGVDSFTYTAYDGSEVSNLATVTITVNNINDAPVADNQSVVTEINTAIAIMLTATNPDGDALVFFVQDDPIHGHLSGTGPNLVYTPDQDYFGTDQFTFVVYESGSISSFSQSRDRSTTGTIDITINPVFELFLPLIIQ